MWKILESADTIDWEEVFLTEYLAEVDLLEEYEVLLDWQTELF